jgi:hypothetical protein
VYIDRIVANHGFHLTELNVHRILLTAILLAAKFLDDAYYNNDFYSKLGGVPLAELNSLELEFLRLTRFELHVTEAQYVSYFNSLKVYAGRKLCMSMNMNMACNSPPLPLSPSESPSHYPFPFRHQQPAQWWGAPPSEEGEAAQFPFHPPQHGGGMVQFNPAFKAAPAPVPMPLPVLGHSHPHSLGRYPMWANCGGGGGGGGAAPAVLSQGPGLGLGYGWSWAPLVAA